MGAAENKIKSQRNAADLLRRGFWHGRRQSVGLSGIPVNAVGSAAYRRRKASQLKDSQRFGNR